ncbi:uncharacterized protein B0P05DRAFT_157402 [Gilbertella persicaria]|uniref:uncharacterized protein n=1 Tax=Gilbertella persicaria TaxID=101096 RepID=UPI00221FE004|nr:uncharacterized protein B0P05DRAFT_157402 [Gilbertella persicaria]KAI8074298.1 hypothetical protein B0P05DRAFT_157402 [Gilbertella persicaria]
MNEDEEIIDIGDDQVKQEAIKNTLSIEQIEWTEPAQTVDTDMDEESRKLIEQMLAEEEYYYGTDTISALNSTKKKKRKPSQQAVDSQTKKSKKEGLSSASMPSHKTRWTEEEDQRLKEALARYSYGNWKQGIKKMMKMMTTMNCL